MVAGHRAAVLDIQWSPFDDTIIASCSEDMTIKVWVIPEKGLEESITEPEASLESVHQRRVGFIAWHPSAHNILMSAGSDNFVVIWNVGTEEPLSLIECHTDILWSCGWNFNMFYYMEMPNFSPMSPRAGSDNFVVIWNVGTEEPLSLIECHTDILWSCGWNYNGTRIVTTCKDKTLRVIDPRTGDVISNNLSEPITLEEIDTSNGVIFPFYDPDNNMVYLGGKGDSNIRYYEVTEQSPYVHYIDRFDTSDPQRGLGFMPKRGVNALQNEIARFYKLHPNKCEPISFTVPRKSELFQEDLYPDTASQVPALSADEWIEGKNADPNLMSIRDEFASVLPAKPKLAGLKKPNALNRPKLAPSKPTSTNSVRDSAPPKPAPEPTPPPPKVERSPPARERERSPPREVHRGSGDRTSVAATAQKLQQQHNAYERQEVHAREEHYARQRLYEDERARQQLYEEERIARARENARAQEKRRSRYDNPDLYQLKKPNALNRPKLAPSKPTSTNSVRDSAPPKPAPEPTPPPPKVERSPPARERERSPPREVHRGSGDRTSVAATAQKLQQQHNAYERQEVHAREEINWL
uniref:Coronin n=1 Tax=Branchiostoma floridae TaxID=7739 RepID=C3XVC5_BRAFL|eukprot:XP_002612042.1 hypothetical protein BRAFLDRAFT_127249 [Branchiostoma floridae]